MIYRGFEILLEQQECNFYSLDADGEVDELGQQCHNDSHYGFQEYVAFDKDTGERFIGADDVETLKAYIDKAYDEAAAKVAA